MSRAFTVLLAKALLFASFAAPAVAAPRCKPADPKRVVLFINANASYNEARAAESAACKAGEKFEMIPNNAWKDLELYEQTSAAVQELRSKYEALNRKYYELKEGDPKGQELRASMDEISNKVRAIQKKAEGLSFNRVSDDMAKDKIAEIAKSGATIASLVVSGHDGGGSIGGQTGHINGRLLRAAITSAYAANPSSTKCPVEGVFLWGCYTAVPDQVIDWKSQISCLKVVGGYFGSAPLAIRPASSELLEQMIGAKQKLSSATNKAQFTAALASLNAFNQTNAAVYACNSNETDPGKGWYAANRTADHGGPARGRLSEVIDCGSDATDRAIYTVFRSVQEYEDGQKDIPEDTARGAIRGLYNMARSLQACIVKNDANNAGFSDRVGMLLFFNGVKQIFARTFEGPIAQAKAEVEAMLAAAAASKDSRAQDFLKKLLPAPDRDSIKKMSRRDLLDYMNRLQRVLSNPSIHSLARDRNSAMDKVQRLSRLMEVYLNARDTRCMEPWLAWHDAEERATPVIPQTPLCQGREN